jgi:hypothetical protein
VAIPFYCLAPNKIYDQVACRNLVLDDDHFRMSDIARVCSHFLNLLPLLCLCAWKQVNNLLLYTYNIKHVFVDHVFLLAAVCYNDYYSLYCHWNEEAFANKHMLYNQVTVCVCICVRLFISQKQSFKICFYAKSQCTAVLSQISPHKSCKFVSPSNFCVKVTHFCYC